MAKLPLGLHRNGLPRRLPRSRSLPHCATEIFDGTPISYHENAMLGDEARTRPEGFYHGMAVKRGKQDYVLIGPSAVFLPSEDVQTPKQPDLFDLL